MRRERENRWLLRGVAEFVADKGAGLTPTEQAMGFFNEMEETQTSLSQHNQSDTVLLNKLKMAFKNYPPMTQAVSRFLNMNLSPLQLATSVRDELVTASIARGQRRTVTAQPATLSSSHGAFFVDDVDFAVEHLVVDRKFSATAKKPPKGRACFICGKDGHFMHSHSDEERERHMTAWRAKRGNSGRGATAYAAEAVDCQHGEDDDPEGSDDDSPDFVMHNVVEWVDERGEEAMQSLTQNKLIHALNATTATTDGFPNYSEEEFQGIIVDTGAAKISSGGYGQFKALKRLMPSVFLDRSVRGTKKVKYGIGIADCLGKTTVKTPIGDLTFWIMDAETPFLLCLQDMNKLQVFSWNTKQVLLSDISDVQVPVVMRFSHAFMVLPEMRQDWAVYSEACFTTADLQRLHRRFGHPSVGRTHTLLEKAGFDEVHDGTNEDLKEALRQVEKYCHQCQVNGPRPQRFQVQRRSLAASL